jgi:hypothetical protein
MSQLVVAHLPSPLYRTRIASFIAGNTVRRYRPADLNPSQEAACSHNTIVEELTRLRRREVGILALTNTP